MKRISTLIFLLAGSCTIFQASRNPQAFAWQKLIEIPAPAYIALHSRPSAGDYAIYEDSRGQLRQEVLSVSGETIEVSQSVPVADSLGSYRLRFLVSPAGQVKEAFVDNLQTGATATLKMGTDPGLDPDRVLKLKRPLAIATGGGKFSCSRVAEVRYAGAIKLYSYHFYADRVAFQLVRSVTMDGEWMEAQFAKGRRLEDLLFNIARLQDKPKGHSDLIEARPR